MNKEKNFISAVVYVHNQEQSIGIFLRNLFKELDSHFERFEIICVDDASTDRSVKEIKHVAATFSQTILTVVHMSTFHGLELAMNAGIDFSIGDFVYEYDSDKIDYEISWIMKVYQYLLEGGYDVVSVSPKGSMKISSRLFYKVYRLFSSGQNSMSSETFRILSRRAINRIGAMNIAVPYRKAVYANCGLKMCNLEYDRKISRECVSVREQQKYRVKLASDALILFTDMGFQCSLWITIVMSAVALVAAVYTIIIYLMGIPVAGWTTTMLFLSAAFGALFTILTIVIKYLTVIVELIFKKQRYRIAEVEKITGKGRNYKK